MSDARTIAVTGATGFVGGHVVRELQARGHTVRALVRSAEGHGLPSGVTPVIGDGTDRASLERLLTGCDACVHLIGIIREAPGGQTFERMHVGATRAVIAACASVGVRRYLHMSALGARPDGRAAYQRTKFEGECLVQASDLDWTIFRPGLIHGPDGEFVQMLKKMASGEIPPYLFMPYFARPKIDDRVPLGGVHWESAEISPVYVGDVATAFADALDRPETVQEIYNLTGDESMTWPEFYRLMRDELPGTKSGLHPWHVPAAHARALAQAAGAVGLGSLLPFDAGQTHMAVEDATADTSKARAHLGFTPRPLRDTVRAYAASC